MKKKLEIGLDIDQVLADFMNPYIDRFGIQPDKMITKHCTKILSKDRDFWINLPKIQDIDFTPSIYCSKRVNPKQWSKDWLIKNGFPNVPLYQLFYQRGNKARMVRNKVDVFIDDSPSNCMDLLKAGIPCLLMDSNWNREFNTPLRIYSLQYSEIEYTYKQAFGNKYNKIW